MSANESPDRAGQDDVLDKELAQLLADEDEHIEDAIAANMSRWSYGTFDLDAFLAEIKEAPGVSMNAALVEVPVRYFVQAQESGQLTGLEIQEDDLGRRVPAGDRPDRRRRPDRAGEPQPGRSRTGR